MLSSVAEVGSHALMSLRILISEIAEQFYPGSGSYNRSDMYKAFADKGYQLVYNVTGLGQIANDQKTLGIFRFVFEATY